MKVAIIKYNAGNIRSVVNSFTKLGVNPCVTDDKNVLLTADKVVLPGQGEASSVMKYIRERGLDEVIKGLKQPVLGICIGLQMMCKYSEEGETEGLDIFHVDVKRFQPECKEDKIPAMGWNEIDDLKTPLFRDVKPKEFVYFVHSYYAPICNETIATAKYVLPYSAALHKDNFYATQFHPEKSGMVGEKIIKNFLEL